MRLGQDNNGHCYTGLRSGGLGTGHSHLGPFWTDWLLHKLSLFCTMLEGKMFLWMASISHTDRTIKSERNHNSVFWPTAASLPNSEKGVEAG